MAKRGRKPLGKRELNRREKAKRAKYALEAASARTTKERVYKLARSKGASADKARAIAADLDAGVIQAHRDIVEIEKACLIGQLRAGVSDKVFKRVREKTGLSISTISRMAGGSKKAQSRVKGATSKQGRPYNPQQNTLTSLGVFLGMEIRAVPMTRGRRQTVSR